MSHALPVEPLWPSTPEGRPVVVLIDVSSRVEERLVTGWVERHRPPGTAPTSIRLAPSRRRRPGARTDSRLTGHLAHPAEPYFLPIRVGWFPHDRGGRRSVSWADLWKLGDPRDPDALRQRIILARWPNRCRIIVAEGALASRLRSDHAASVEVLSPVDFVTRRAWLALERAERRQRGDRYKVPKFLHEEISARAEFQEGSIRHGARGLPPAPALARARHYLKEIAASHSPFVIDLIANAIHWVYSQGYGAIVYDREKVAEIASLGRTHPLAFLPSHRSNLDRLSLQFLLWENDLPPNHTAGGINMNFFPVGPLIRRTGVFFIRRSFVGNDLYKFVLRSYLDYLIAHRFPLEWYLEGGRSRSGKLLPPRYGLLAYVVDSVRRGKSEDLYLVPVSIAYDHIQEVSSYAGEARGGVKQAESFGWLVGVVRSLRRRYGNIHVRFGEPISVSEELSAGEMAEGTTDLAKLAFEVMYRVGKVTPITPTAVVAITLLAARGRARTCRDMAGLASQIDAYVESRRLPTTEPMRLEDPAEVLAVVSQLAAHGHASSFRGPEGTVFWLDADQSLRASYYRNTVVHFFVPRAITELALLAAAASSEGDRPAAFWQEVGRLRDLLKFEFFFSDRDRFRAELAEDLALDVPDWEEQVKEGGAGELLSRLRPLAAGWALLPFLDAYRLVGDQLEATGGAFEEKPFLAACLTRGKDYRLRGILDSDESVSQVLFKTALSLAGNRGLLEEGAEANQKRAAFAAEMREVASRARQVAALAG